MTAETATVTNLPTASPVAFTERDAFELALRKAKVYAASTLVPAQYQDNIPNCLIAMNMAKRIGSDELQTMQNLYIVHGNPGWSGQFLIATFNQCGKFTAMRFEWRGKQGDKDWGCRAYATEKATGHKIEGAWVTWKMVEAEGWNKKAGSKWLTMPEQMFMYRTGAFLVRTHAPEIAMGLQTIEELRDVIDLETEPAPTKAAAIANVLRERIAPIAPEGAPPSPPAEPADVRLQDRPPLELDGDAPPALSYAEVREALELAKTDDAKALALDMIRSVADAKQREELAEIARLLEIDAQ